MEISASLAQWQVGHRLFALSLQTCAAAAMAAQLQITYSLLLEFIHGSQQCSEQGLFLRKLSGVEKNNTNFHYF